MGKFTNEFHGSEPYFGLHDFLMTIGLLIDVVVLLGITFGVTYAMCTLLSIDLCVLWVAIGIIVSIGFVFGIKFLVYMRVDYLLDPYRCGKKESNPRVIILMLISGFVGAICEEMIGRRCYDAAEKARREERCRLMKNDRTNGL